MQYSFLLISNDTNFSNSILKLFGHFQNYFCCGTVTNENENEVVEKISNCKPDLILIHYVKSKGISFKTLNEMHQYFDIVPYFIVISDDTADALEAIQSGVSDFWLPTLPLHILGKSLFKFEKLYTPRIPQNICIKSYSDYHFVNLMDIVYLKADNNTTDIFMANNKVVAAYKTLKHFETILPFYFLRIHKSYIVNVNHISRIHFSKSKCYLNYNSILPFSANYRENVDLILNNIL